MITIYSDEDAELKSEWSEIINGWLVHTKINKWSLSKYKKYLGILGFFINSIPQKEIFAIPLTEKDKKWQELFGFKDTGIRYNNYILMRLSWD